MAVDLIDKYTEPTFTSSAKGLLTLFAIGFIHQTLGVTLIGDTIDIPGVPQIKLQSLEQWSLIYTAALTYATYRYFLHNKAQISLLLGRALSEGFHSGWIGNGFIRLTMLKTGVPYNVTHIPFPEEQGSSAEPPNSVRISSFSSDDSPSEWLYICFGESLLPQAIVSEVELIQGLNQKALNKYPSLLLWGKFRYEDPSQNDLGRVERTASYHLTYLSSLCFTVLGIVYCIKLLTHSPRAFDVFLPLILCLGMLLHFYVPIPSIVETVYTYVSNLLS